MPCILPVSVAKCCVWLLVVPNKPRLHLLLQFLKGYVLQIVVKPFLVGAVRSFNFAVVPWCIRSNKLVLYAEPLHYPVGNMNLTVARPFGVRELRSVVGLNCDRRGSFRVAVKARRIRRLPWSRVLSPTSRFRVCALPCTSGRLPFVPRFSFVNTSVFLSLYHGGAILSIRKIKKRSIIRPLLLYCSLSVFPALLFLSRETFV